MKSRLIRIGVLAGVFVLAVIIFSYVTNRGNTDLTADMGGATLPRISFGVEGYTANNLIGYTNEMDIAAMRDTIIPVSTAGGINLNVQAYDRKITSLDYEILSLNGETSIYSDTVKDVKESLALQLGDSFTAGLEGVLKITLHVDKGEDIYYYTRVVKSDELAVKQCMDFANDFHTRTFDKGQMESMATQLEPDAEAANMAFQQVDIHSDMNHITWGDLKPSIVGDVLWSIKESNSSYTSLLLEYRVTCAGEVQEAETYNIKEFFRVRYQEGTIYLLDYNRTMNQIFSGNNNAITDKGIILGMTPLEIPHMTNQDGTIVSFVQERELWNYDQKNDALSLVFSFSSEESKDLRYLTSKHEVKLVAMDDNGNTTFVVYGYMNRGEQEGKVGAAVYYYDIEKNAVEEKVFIPSNKSFEIAKDELGRLVYYNHVQEVLYIMTAGTLHKVDLEEEEQEVLVQDLKLGQYIASEDGHLLAYQTNGELKTATKVKVLNLATGKDFEIESGEGENIKPLGFVRNDFVYGVSKLGDVGKTVAGQTVLPMYKLEICDIKGKVAKSYLLEQVHILDAFVEGNMVTLNRVVKNGEIYTGIAKDYITNNEETVESNIMLTTNSSELKEQETWLTFSEGIQDKNAKLLKPKQVLYENPTTVSFEETNTNEKYYVYGKGEMIGAYDNAGYAVQKADACSGVVITGKQSYVWERGNRDLTFELDNIAPFALEEGETTLAACLRQMLAIEGNAEDVKAELAAGKSPVEIISRYSGGMALDLTGCTTEQMLYIISKGTPVIAMTDSENAILLTGYGKVNVQYMNPASGTVELQPFEIIDQMVAGSGNTFIGYVK